MVRKKCLVIGYGSAGSRHAKNARYLGCEVALVTNQIVDSYRCYSELPKAIKKENPQFIIIASPTNKHVKELKQCMLQNIPYPKYLFFANHH